MNKRDVQAIVYAKWCYIVRGFSVAVSVGLLLPNINMTKKVLGLNFTTLTKM